MKKRRIAISVCVLLGLISGYFAASPASFAFIEATEPDMFGAFSFFLVDSPIVCDRRNKPPAESIKSVTGDLNILQRWQTQNPNSHLITQEIGLTKIRLAILERKLGHDDQANADLKQAQTELKSLGWRDISEAHLIVVNTRLTINR